MGIWQEHFSWTTLSRWDLLGVVIPGFPIAVGVGILGVDWFPQNLLISQICLSAAATILTLKFLAIAVQAKGQPLFSRIAFAIVLGSGLLISTTVVVAKIQRHKIDGERDKEQAALFKSMDDFLLRKDEVELRETFDIPAVVRDTILEAKAQLAPDSATQIEKDTIARDMSDGQNVFYYRYVRRDGFKISPLPGKSGVLHLTPKAVEARKKLADLYSSSLIPSEIAEPLRDLEKAIADNQELLMDTINETYADDPSGIANAFECPKTNCTGLINRFYARFIQLQPKAYVVTDRVRKFRESRR